MIRFSLVAITIIGMALLGVRYCHGAAPQCQLSLTLLSDASASIKPAQHKLIREGTAWALNHENLRYSLIPKNASDPRIMVRVIEYADQQDELVPFTMINTRADVEAIAAQVLTRPRSPTQVIGHSTGTGMALENARRGFLEVPCARNVVDVLFDGESNAGILTADVLKAYREETDQVNVLFLQGAYPIATAQRVQFGPLAFTVLVAGYEDVGRAMLRKLQMEVAWGMEGKRA
jgi:hypothetical protein